MPLEMVALSGEEIEDALREVQLWTHDVDRHALYRRITFRDFSDALAFMVQIGIEAEKVEHHPEWMNVYNRVDIWLTTHDASGITKHDVYLARYINGVAAKYRSNSMRNQSGSSVEQA